MGRLLGGEHASTPQSGVEAPRLLKRSLPRLYYVVVAGGWVCVVCVRGVRVCVVCVLYVRYVWYVLIVGGGCGCGCGCGCCCSDDAMSVCVCVCPPHHSH